MPLFCPPTKSTRRPPCPKTNPNWLSLSRGCSQNIKKSNRRLIISPPGTKRGRSIQRFWWVFLSQLCSPLQRMCSSLRFRFTISLPPTSPGWRWTKMTRWVLYFQSFISITRIISIFSIDRWSHCPGGSCQSQCDSLWILLRALLRLSRLGPVVWRALRGLRLHKEHTGGKQWFLKTWGKFGTLSGLRAPLGWVELPGEKNLNSHPDLNLLNLLIILPWKYVPTIKCFSSKVLSPVFTVHWGLAKKKGRPTWRERFFFKCVFLIDFLSPGKTQTIGRGSLTSRRNYTQGFQIGSNFLSFPPSLRPMIKAFD